MPKARHWLGKLRQRRTSCLRGCAQRRWRRPIRLDCRGGSRLMSDLHLQVETPRVGARASRRRLLPATSVGTMFVLHYAAARRDLEAVGSHFVAGAVQPGRRRSRGRADFPEAADADGLRRRISSRASAPSRSLHASALRSFRTPRRRPAKTADRSSCQVRAYRRPSASSSAARSRASAIRAKSARTRRLAAPSSSGQCSEQARALVDALEARFRVGHGLDRRPAPRSAACRPWMTSTPSRSLPNSSRPRRTARVIVSNFAVGPAVVGLLVSAAAHQVDVPLELQRAVKALSASTST